MRELLQSLRSASPELVEGALRPPGPGQVRIRTAASVVSPGTERMLVAFAGAGLIDKVRQHPERVRQLAEKARTDGVVATMDAVRTRMETPIALGYASAGVVVACGPGVRGLQPGQRVATTGPHAEEANVAATLAVAVPDSLPSESAAFASLGAIALESVRLAEPAVGERFVVTGLGLIGLLAVQLLRAAGCRVLGVDPDPHRRELAAAFGAMTAASGPEALGAAEQLSAGRGVDGVVLAAATASSEPVHDAATMCRRHGRIVLVGVTGLELERADFYDKELRFQVSCAHGPGRYDPAYERAGADYPMGEVRWTAGRNLEAVVELMADGRIEVAPLVSHRFPFARADDAYRVLTEEPGALGIVLEFPPAAEDEGPTGGTGAGTLLAAPSPAPRPAGSASRGRSARAVSGSPGIGVIGTGSFATGTVLPALAAAGARLVAVSGGTGASWAAQRFSVARTLDRAEAVVEDPEVDAVFVLTRHDSHASLVRRCLAAGKAVFVEKPLAITASQLDEVARAWDEAGGADGAPVVGIGFNRRFSPFTETMVGRLRATPVPKVVSILVNAGALPTSHWTRDPAVGGGRMVGEGCHFIDLARHLTGSRIVSVTRRAVEGAGADESAVVLLGHEDGSVSTVAYLANGSRRYPKERIIVFAGGAVWENDNFRHLTVAGRGDRPRHRLRQDKGHQAGIAAFLAAVAGDAPYPIPFEEILEVSAATLLAATTR